MNINISRPPIFKGVDLLVVDKIVCSLPVLTKLGEIGYTVFAISLMCEI